MLKQTIYYGLVLLASYLPLSAQIDASFLRDSIEIEKGVSGTTAFEPFFRLVNQTFDDQNRPLSSIIYRYVSEDELEPRQRQTFAYDTEGYTVLFRLEDWNGSSAEWEVVKQEESVYENGRLLSLLRKKPEGGTLQNDRRWTYTYNGSDMETEKLLAEWNTDQSAWRNLSRKTTTYNPAGSIEQQLLERFSGGSWKNTRRRAWTYVADQLQPSQTSTQIWSDAEQAWINDSRTNYGTAPNGLWSGSVLQNWNSSEEAWENDVKETFVLDLNSSAVSYSLERWEGEWEEDLRSQFMYSANETTALLQQWNDSSPGYENFLRYRSLFNTDQLPVEQTGMQVWNAASSNWQNEDYTRRITYFWRAAEPNATKEPIPNHCNVPNPYRSGSTIACELPTDSFVTLEVYNLYGQLVHVQQVDGSTFDVNTSSFPAGLYVFRIAAKGQTHHLEKVVVAH